MGHTFDTVLGGVTICWVVPPGMEAFDDDFCDCDVNCDCTESEETQPDILTLSLSFQGPRRDCEPESLIEAFLEMAALGRPEVTREKGGIMLRWQRPDPEPT